MTSDKRMSDERGEDQTRKTWRRMLARCHNKSHRSYRNYGGRGISVCDRWAQSYHAFLKDMGTRPSGRTLDRINNDGNYEPGNCRWATAKEQQRNKRNSRLVTIDGKTLTLAEWSEVSGILSDTLGLRLRLGWSGQRLLSPAIHQRHRTHCPYGHEYTEANTILRSSSPGRTCRQCKSERKAERQERATKARRERRAALRQNGQRERVAT